MTARFAVPLSALLLLSVAAVASAGQVAELVPVDPVVPPAAYYGLPAPETEIVAPSARPSGAPAPASAPGKAAPAKSAPPKNGPAELEDGWEGGAAKDKDGKFAYCVIEGGFTTGHVLMIARSQKGEINIGIGIPGATLPRGEQWPVTVIVDGKLKRERLAIAPQPDMLVVSNGKDEELVTALMNGKELVVASASDRIAFALKGTKKVLTDLKTCVDKGGNVPPIKTSTGVKPAQPPKAALPQGLASLLTAAGVHDAELVPMDKVPADQRPADVAWRFGPIVGGIRERIVGEGATLDDLSGAFAQSMKGRCEGTGTVTLNPSEPAGAITLRTGSVDCAMPQGTLHVSLTFLLSQARLFTVLFHEAGEEDVALADKVRDNLTQVLRKAGTTPVTPPASTPAPAPAPAQVPAPQTAPAVPAPAKP